MTTRAEVRAQSSQSRYPWRATLRTIVQVGIPAVLTLGIVVPLVVDIILEEVGEAAPPWAIGALLGVAAFVTTASAILARVMAIPAVNEWLSRCGWLGGLAATPPAKVDAALRPGR